METPRDTSERFLAETINRMEAMLLRIRAVARKAQERHRAVTGVEVPAAVLIRKQGDRISVAVEEPQPGPAG